MAKESKVEMTGYCVKCKKKQKMENWHEDKLANKMMAAKGQCIKCGTKMCKILGKAK